MLTPSSIALSTSSKIFVVAPLKIIVDTFDFSSP